MLFKSFILGQIAAYASATTIYRECLQYSDATGKDAEEPMKFEHYGSSVREMPLFDSSMRVSKIDVCKGGNSGELKGFSFTLSDPTGENHDTVQIPVLGKNGGSRAICDTIEVDSRIKKIKVSLTSDRKFVDGISFLREGEVNFDTYGRITAPLKSWNFEEDKPMIGMFGKHNRDNIKQLGWVMLDTAC